MIEAVNLSKTYQVGSLTIDAVKDVTLHVAGGEFVAIVGHSGSGKSTLLSMIGGLTRPSAGKILLDGEDIWAMDDTTRSHIRNKKIGFIFQFASLIPTLTSLGNVVLPKLFDPKGIRAADYERAAALLDQVGLSDKKDAYPGELSGGQQRRVAIARALMAEPAILLADEPTGDLDEETEAEIMDLLIRWIRMRGATMLMVTHEPDISAMADRTLRMKQGVLLDANTAPRRNKHEAISDRRS